MEYSIKKVATHAAKAQSLNVVVLRDHPFPKMATAGEQLNASVSWSALLLSIGVAAVLAILLHYVFFREEDPAQYEVAIPDELSPSYAWDLRCTQDGAIVEHEVSVTACFPGTSLNHRSRYTMERYISIAQQTAAASASQ
jgi:hypothetical protein